jgi:hypothetical protein
VKTQKLSSKHVTGCERVPRVRIFLENIKTFSQKNLETGKNAMQAPASPESN